MTRHSVLGTERGLIKHNVQVSRNNQNINLSGHQAAPQNREPWLLDYDVTKACKEDLILSASKNLESSDRSKYPL